MPTLPRRNPGTAYIPPGVTNSRAIRPAMERPSSPPDSVPPLPTSLGLDDYVAGVRAGSRAVLARAITLVESTREDHQTLARQVLERLLPYTGDALRLGITGAPGVGKSTFLEALGTYLTAQGHRVAVLAIDPTSERTRGSILGDKTRMERLSIDPNAFIRPSASGGTLGGVARATRESILLCEAAGYDVVFVETVGVGQSEVAVDAMVDFFLLLVQPGAGDELQGIKRGIVEMADALVVTKADGVHQQPARQAATAYRGALRLFPPATDGARPPVLLCSALTGEGIAAVFTTITEILDRRKASGQFQEQRRAQARQGLYQALDHLLREAFLAHPVVQQALSTLEAQVVAGTLSPYTAAQQLVQTWQDTDTNAGLR